MREQKLAKPNQKIKLNLMLVVHGATINVTQTGYRKKSLHHNLGTRVFEAQHFDNDLLFIIDFQDTSLYKYYSFISRRVNSSR